MFQCDRILSSDDNGAVEGMTGVIFALEIDFIAWRASLVKRQNPKANPGDRPVSTKCCAPQGHSKGDVRWELLWRLIDQKIENSIYVAKK